PANGIRVRGHDYSGYETDTGLVTSRGYGPRYYGRPPPPPPPPPLHVPPAMPYPYYPAGIAAPPAPHLLRERHHE
ncbi:unnamed protein product, partial [Rotaria magnacalcarata]